MSETFIKLTDKLYIYKDKKSKNFYVYLRKKEGSESERSIRISTRTSDIEQATRKAWALYTNYHDSSFIEEVSKRKQPTVKKIGLKVIELLMIEDKKINTDYIRVINEIIEKIGSTRIKKLDRIIVKDYLSEFANSKTQLTIRKSCFNKIINRAIDEKIITEAEAIKVPTVKLKQADTKQMFNHEHLSIFSENIDNFINEAKRESSRDKRFIFKHYMTFLLETGARSGEETSHIKFSDFVVEEKENIIRENVSTNHQMISSISIPKLNKKGLIDRDYVHLKITAGKIHSKSKRSFREIVVNSKALIAINEIINKIHRKGDKSIHDNHPLFQFKNTLKDSYLFKSNHSNVINQQFERMFSDFCEYCKIDHKEEAISLYSFRHSYITNMLKAKKSPALIAAQCGTSIEMIDRYYNKLTTRMNRDELL